MNRKHKNQSVAGQDADLIHDNICFFTFVGGYSMLLKRPTRQAISSGWVQTAGAQRSLRLCTRRRWQRELSPSCPNGSPSKVQRRALCIHKVSLYNKAMHISLKSTFHVIYSCVCWQKNRSCFVIHNHHCIIRGSKKTKIH